MSWLTNILTNKWMNDPNFLAQSAHFFGSYAAMLTAEALWGHTGSIITGIVFMLAAALKEFWYDANYELPKQTAFDNILDFSFYGVGTIAGLLVDLLVKHHS